MNKVTIYHNPRCSKSREALELIRESGTEPTIVEYMKEVPSEAELKKLLMKLGQPAESILRRNEPIFKEKFKGLQFNEDEWVKVMTEEPRLIERPIVVRGHKAVVGRPMENVIDLIEG